MIAMSGEKATQSISRRNLLTSTSGAVATTPLLSQSTTADSHRERIDNPGKINWNITHPDDTDNRFYSVCETTEPNEYIIVGWSDEAGGFSGEPDTNVLLYRVTQSGSVVWKKELNFDFPVKANDVIHTGDGKFYVCGGLLKSDGETLNEGIVIKFDDLGEIEWNHTLPANNGTFVTLTHHQDEIFVAGGQKLQNNFSSDFVSWLVKMNPSGEFVWEETYNKGEPCRSISYSSNGIALATLNIDSTQGSLIVTSLDGSLEYARRFDLVYPKSILWGTDGNLYLCGDTDEGSNGGDNVAFLSYNKAGSQRYNRILDPGAEGTLASDSLIETDNGFVTTGWFEDPGMIGSNQKGWILEYDQDGIISSHVVGGSGKDWINSFVVTSEDAFLTVGSTTSFGDTENKNAWISSVTTEESPPEPPEDSSDDTSSENPTDSVDSGFGFIFSNLIKISVGIAVFIFLLMLMASFEPSNDPDDNNSGSISLDDQIKDKSKKEKYETDEYGQIKDK